MRTSPQTVLVVDDEVAIADLVVEILRQGGYDAKASYGGEEALDLARRIKPDLFILDIMMPNVDGMEVLQKVREFSLAPVLFLTAKDTEADKVVAFSLGADDYIEKPFKKRELLARVEAHLRRAQEYHYGLVKSAMRGAEIELFSDRHEAFYRGRKLELTPKEFAMLRMLLEAHGKPVSTQLMYESVWNEKPDHSAHNTIMVHIRNLRKKIENVAMDEGALAGDADSNLSRQGDVKTADPTYVNPIQTVWGTGYKIDV